MSEDRLNEILIEQSLTHQRFVAESKPILRQIVELIRVCLQDGGKLLLCGNGGSAADAQHVAAEFVGRFARERSAFPAMALTTDSSILTAVGNDYGFDDIFKRQIEAWAKPGDIVAGISTSGNSSNIIKALSEARAKGAQTIGFTGGNGGELPKYCDLCFIAPAKTTARIQELHIAAWHIICDLVEESLIK
jgi:D-sedoheptulose 7-phosphate isomerase